MTAYYNEIDPFAAQWLRNLITAGLIPPGEVDERSIHDVRADDLAGFVQCHFFAGIGGWPHALRLAGWPDDRPVWTGSCPCQPFSAAGRGGAETDARHLWPEFARLIGERRPATVFGEQVASKLGRDWLANVRTEMEAMGYAVGAADLCAAGVGAPHIRQRLWFVGERMEYGVEPGLERHGGHGDGSDKPGRLQANAAGSAPEASSAGGLADADSKDQGRWGVQRPGESDGAGNGATRERSEGLCADGGMANANSDGRAERREGQFPTGGYGPIGNPGVLEGQPSTGPLDRFWRDADRLFCRDGKWRPVEPGTFPLAHGVPNRVGLLRGYGNAVVPQDAAAFIAAYHEARWPVTS